MLTGSFSTATCMRCKRKVDAEFIRHDVNKQVIPLCPVCPRGSDDDVNCGNVDVSTERCDVEACEQFAGAPSTTTTSNEASTLEQKKENNEKNNDLADKPILKPDIVFFGESLSDEFHQTFEGDKQQCDLLIVMGTHLKVKPVAIIPGRLV